MARSLIANRADNKASTGAGELAVKGSVGSVSGYSTKDLTILRMGS